MAISTRTDWIREEMILACEVAFDRNWKPVRSNTPEVVELSRLLRRADYHDASKRYPKFRDVGSVGMKVNNFCAWNPQKEKKGLRVSRGEWPVFEGFWTDPARMKLVAADIRKQIVDGAPAVGDSDHFVLAEFSTAEPGLVEAAEEGGLRAVASYRRERDPKLREAKLASVLAEGRAIQCEVCDFNFGAQYGQRGEGYIEVHHVTPLHISGMVSTSLSDLVLLCANCHRMIHRSGWITVNELERLVHR